MGPHILEDLTHKMEGTQPVKKEVIWALGVYVIYMCVYIYILMEDKLINPTKKRGGYL